MPLCPLSDRNSSKSLRVTRPRLDDYRCRMSEFDLWAYVGFINTLNSQRMSIISASNCDNASAIMLAFCGV